MLCSQGSNFTLATSPSVCLLFAPSLWTCSLCVFFLFCLEGGSICMEVLTTHGWTAANGLIVGHSHEHSSFPHSASYFAPILLLFVCVLFCYRHRSIAGSDQSWDCWRQCTCKSVCAFVIFFHLSFSSVCLTDWFLEPYSLFSQRGTRSICKSCQRSPLAVNWLIGNAVRFERQDGWIRHLLVLF